MNRQSMKRKSSKHSPFQVFQGYYVFCIRINHSMDVHKELIKDGILSLENSEQIKKFERDKAMSVHWELRTILYLGILLLLLGIGILVYQNIDTIGHTVIIVAIAAGCGACFYYG